MRLRHWLGLVACLVVVLVAFMRRPHERHERVDALTAFADSKPSPAQLEDPGAESTRTTASSARAPAAELSLTGKPLTLGSLRVRVVTGQPPRGCEQIAVILIATRSGFGAGKSIEQLTDAQGYAHFRALRGGNLRLSTSRGGSELLELKPGEHAEVEIAIEAGFTLRGSVRSLVGDPIGQAEVWLCNSVCTDTGHVATRTLSNGTFEIQHVYPARGIAVRAKGYSPSAIHPVGTGAPLEIVMQPTERGNVCGFVLDESSTPIADAVLELRSRQGLAGQPDPATGLCPAPQSITRTDATGLFRFEDASDAVLELRVFALGFVSRTITIKAEPPGICTMTVRMQRGHAIKGLVVDSSNATVPFTWVSTIGSKDGRTTETDESGAFELLGLSPGATQLEAAHRDGREGRVTVDVKTDAVTECRITLSDGRVLSGRAVTDENEPLNNWVIGATTGRTCLWTVMTRTDASGEFKLLNCPPGDFVLECVHPDNWAAAIGSLPITAGDKGPVSFVIPRAQVPSCYVVGSIVSAENGTSVANAMA